jgi:hypothetical protein
MGTEADKPLGTFITPKLEAAGWESDPHWIAEQRSFTDSRVVDGDGKQLCIVKLEDSTFEKVRSLFARPENLRARWADAGPDELSLALNQLRELLYAQ